jgi:hypothetical protein
MAINAASMLLMPSRRSVQTCVVVVAVDELTVLHVFFDVALWHPAAVQ